MTRIRDLSIDEKPKERLIQFGSQALSNTELLAILINTGSRGHSSIDIALICCLNANHCHKSKIYL